MKTKTTLLVLFTFVLASCSKYYGHGPYDDDDEFVLTENNYIYEGELYKFILNGQIDSLEQRAKELSAFVKENPKLQEELDATNKLLKETAEAEAEVATVFDVIDLLGRRGPKPPEPPRPGVLPDDLRYIIVSEVQSLALTGTDKAGNTVVKADNGSLSPISGTQGMLQIQELSVEQLQPGDLINLQIKRTDRRGISAGYMIETKVAETKK